MNPQIKKWFIVIVHHGKPKVTDALVQTITSQSKSIYERLIVVDHSEVQYQNRNDDLRITVIRQENLGYFGGLAAGLKELQKTGIKSTDVIVCLNNDVTMDPQALTKIQDWWNKTKVKGLAGASLSSVNLLTGRTHIATTANSAWEITYVHGSILVVPYSLFQNVPLPKDYFLYWEDVALSLRAQQAGYKLFEIPDVGLQHPDVKKIPSPKQLYFLVRNGAAFLQSETPTPWRVWWSLANTTREAYHNITGHTDIAHALHDRTIVHGKKRK